MVPRFNPVCSCGSLSRVCLSRESTTPLLATRCPRPASRARARTDGTNPYTPSTFVSDSLAVLSTLPLIAAVYDQKVVDSIIIGDSIQAAMVGVVCRNRWSLTVQAPWGEVYSIVQAGLSERSNHPLTAPSSVVDDWGSLFGKNWITAVQGKAVVSAARLILPGDACRRRALSCSLVQLAV